MERECYVIIEEEIRMIQLQAKECEKLIAPTGARKRQGEILSRVLGSRALLTP
jgi:hypothetical protein